MPSSSLIARYESFPELVEAGFRAARSHAALLLPAAVVYDGIGPLLVEWALPAQEAGLQSLSVAVNLFVSGTLGFLGAYAVARGLWRLSRADAPTPLQVVAAPWREAEWAIPLAFLYSAIMVTGFVLGIVPALVAEVFLIVLAPVAAVEHKTAFEALRRAFLLGHGHRLRAVGILAILAAGLIATSIPVLAFENADAGVLIVAALLTAAVDFLGYSLAFVLYGDLRLREGPLSEAAVPGGAP